MKIIISYPPFRDIKGTPMLAQNRQYQVFSEKAVIYPIVPAQAATLLKEAGHEVIWNDCIAEGWNYNQFIEFIKKEEPDVVVFETKTPVVKQHWKIIDDLKQLSTLKSQLSTVLVGDHVTALPEESFQNSNVDYVLMGGDYDFLLLNLCNNLKPLSTCYSLLATKLEPGIWYREDGQINPSTALRIDGERSRTIKNTGKFQLNHDLNSLPFIDRDLTKWWLYAYENGNYKRFPGTYITSGRDCWHRENGGCSFCSWTTLYPSFRTRTPNNVLDEIGILIEKYNVKEIMDDCGTSPVGEWLRRFCDGMIKRGYNKKIYLDCNFRFGSVSLDDYRLMKKAGYRLLLFGLESANQSTLERIHKNVTVSKIIESCRLARKAGLFPHITIMFGYPWETYEDALKTLQLGKWLLRKGYAYTMQATVIIPYPGTALFEECRNEGLLNTSDWERFDMKEPVMKTSIPQTQIMEFVQGMYRISFDPQFLFRKMISCRDIDDVKYSFRAAKKVVGHIFDFNFKRKNVNN